MASFKQASLSGGIISPQLRGHSDQAKYATGVRDAVNFVVTREGTLENRAGTIYVANEHGTVASKLVKFVVSQSLAYVLEFGWNGTNAYVRVYQNEQLLTLTGVATWSALTQYTGGQFVLYSGVYYWASAPSLNAIPSSSPVTLWYPLPGNVMEFDLVLVQSPLYPNLNWLNTIAANPAQTFSMMTFVQINDVMTVASQAFQPFQITFGGPDTQGILQWAVTEFVATTPILAPTITSISPNGSPSTPPAAPATLTAVGGNAALTADYTVAAYTIDVLGGSSPVAIATVGHATSANHVVLTWGAVTGALGYAIYAQVGGSGPLELIALVGPVTTYTDTGAVPGCPVYVSPTAPVGPTPPGYSTYSYEVTSVDSVTGVESEPSAAVSVFSLIPTPPGTIATYGAPIIVRWGAVTGAASYNIYRSDQSSTIYGFVGSVSQMTSPVFADYVTNPDLAIQPPQAITGTNGGAIFGSANDYPAVVGAYQQRLLFANSINQPQTVWGSRIGSYLAFTESTPIQADDALQFTLAGRQIQPVLALVDIGKLIVHTLSGEYIAQGDQSGTLLPTAINIVQQGTAGCQPVQPISIGIVDLFVQARGSILRDIAFTIQSYSYKGEDRTKFVPDLIAGRSIIAMDWQQVPNSILWCVLNDGTLLSFTYSIEDTIWSWTRHTTAMGSFESVVVIPEGGEDAVYLQVLRLINGTSVRYIERMADRASAVLQETNASALNPQAIFVDSSESYDGRNSSQVSPYPADTMTLTGGGWQPTSNLTLTLSNAANPLHFVAGDATPPSNTIVLQQITTAVTWDSANNPIPIGTVIDTVSLLITAYTSATVVTCTPSKPVPTWAQGVPLTTWGKAVHTFTASNLPNCPLTGLGDCDVIPLTTANGSGTIVTQQNYLQVSLGLQIVAQMETLDLENAQGNTITDKQKRVSEVTVYFYDSRGGKYGQTFDQLQPWVQRQNEAWGSPVSLATGPVRIPLPGNWGATGQVCVEQRLPLPLGIAAIIPTALVGN